MINVQAKGELRFLLVLFACMSGLLVLLGIAGMIEVDTTGERITSPVCAAPGEENECETNDDCPLDCQKCDDTKEPHKCVADCPPDKPICTEDGCVENCDLENIEIKMVGQPYNCGAPSYKDIEVEHDDYDLCLPRPPLACVRFEEKICDHDGEKTYVYSNCPDETEEFTGQVIVSKPVETISACGGCGVLVFEPNLNREIFSKERYVRR